MAKAQPKLVLAPAQGIPFNLLVLSQANVRRVKNGVTIEQLAADIERRGLLQGLSVRPLLDADGQDTGTFHVPAGGRRFRALEILVKRKRLAADAIVPCVVKPADADVSAEEDSLAENVQREALHPLDEFRGMKNLVDQGGEIEDVAARFHVTPAVVRQRLKLACVSPALHEVYAADGMTSMRISARSVSTGSGIRSSRNFMATTAPKPVAGIASASRLLESASRAFPEGDRSAAPAPVQPVRAAIFRRGLVARFASRTKIAALPGPPLRFGGRRPCRPLRSAVHDRLRHRLLSPGRPQATRPQPGRIRSG
ncbi:MAG: ParB N-terminal domain-containing protein [Sphingomonas sp.]|uniref:ParB/RepB/Spo0J family partition protein n=1 Tax=Sphingomonas sp. TaxID=28214 RepID=UPI00343ABB4A|nr:ParB N-terminal domain-containing protein [Sphingomonas sp.]